MSLLNPTRGELLDRYSILELKIANSEEPRRGVWLTELAAIEARLDLSPDAIQVSERYRALRHVNRQIWNANVDLAFLINKIIAPPNGHALAMFRWNQERIDLIEAIDREAGQFVQHEKVGY